MIVGKKKKKKKNNKESQYKVLHPETGSDSLIGLDWELGHDTRIGIEYPCLNFEHDGNRREL